MCFASTAPCILLIVSGLGSRQGALGAKVVRFFAFLNGIGKPDAPILYPLQPKVSPAPFCVFCPFVTSQAKEVKQAPCQTLLKPYAYYVIAMPMQLYGLDPLAGSQPFLSRQN